MDKLNSLDDLRRMRDRLRVELRIRENSNRPEELPQIRVAMGVCGIAAGAKETLARFVAECAAKDLDAVVTQSGCLGYCSSEPTVEVEMPGCKPVLFSDVTPARATQIIEHYILGGGPAEGVLE